nr:NS2 [Myzus persicae densovirus 2]
MSISQEVNQQQFNDEEEIPCGQRYTTAATIQTDHQQTGVNGSTPMFELKSTARKEYGTSISADMALTLKTLCKVLECKATELTVTCIIPLIALLLPDHMWSEATSSDRWRYRLRNATYWISNPTRESEYQALLRWMEEKMPIPLAKWQGACLPRYGEAMSDMFLTSLYPEEIGQLMELLRTYAGVSQSECQNACTSSANTATTSTSYTPVTTPRAAVDVVSYSTPLLSNYVDDDAFERMLESSNYQKETGPVSFNTYVHRPGMSKKWAASTLMEDYVVDIHIYQKDQIQNVDPNDWWKHAFCRARGSFNLNSPYVKMAKTIQQEVFRRMTKMEYKITDPQMFFKKKKKAAKRARGKRSRDGSSDSE